MDNNRRFSDPSDPDRSQRSEPLRSPIRPTRPADPAPQRPTPPPAASGASVPLPNDPHQALTELRQKMETVAAEFAQGKINRAQFNAMYGRYSEQRVIIQRLIERNPESKAWKQVLSSTGHTEFLRSHFGAQALYYIVYRHNASEPLIVGGKTTPQYQTLMPILKGLWSMPNRPKSGLARKAMGEDLWLIVALGEYAVSLVMFLLEPSSAQAAIVRDLHADFERANHAALARDTGRLDRMVFPQRALVEESF